jgi:hypothetical protein
VPYYHLTFRLSLRFDLSGVSRRELIILLTNLEWWFIVLA